MQSLDRRTMIKVISAGMTFPLLPSNVLLGCGEAEPERQTPRSIIEPIFGELPVHNDWWLSGNYAPVEESEAAQLEVIGALPVELNGTYVRNGPNPATGESSHWFGGDGMLHAVRLEAGQAPWYRARYIDTEFYQAPPEPGSIPSIEKHQANTSIIRHADRWLCLAEGGLPYEVDSELSTKGIYRYEGSLNGPMTAHPKLDPNNGELHFFGYQLFPPGVNYYVANENGELIHSTEIEFPAGTMVHDFQLTESHVIFMDLPLLFNLELAIAGDTMPFRWSSEHQARIGILPRNKEGAEIQWFNIESCFVFHMINAYNDPDMPNEVVLSAVRYPDFWNGQTDDFGSGGEVWIWRLNLETGEVNERLFNEHLVEFPVINPMMQGKAQRYGYAIGSPRADKPEFSAVIKYDFQLETQQLVPLAIPYHLGELKFIPAKNANSEDHGWLIGYGFNSETRGSELLILDAKNLSETPVARVILPTRVPFGFHGEWFEQRDPSAS